MRCESVVFIINLLCMYDKKRITKAVKESRRLKDEKKRIATEKAKPKRIAPAPERRVIFDRTSLSAQSV